MGILDFFKKLFSGKTTEKTETTETSTVPKSFQVGKTFEDYVRNFLFIKGYYDLIERTHDYETNKNDYVESSLKPDFKFRDKLSKKEFYVEAKFRSNLFNGKIEWCTEEQLRRYSSYDKECPTFLILGFGGTPEKPELVALIPLKEARYTGLFLAHAQKFEIERETAIPSKVLWAR